MTPLDKDINVACSSPREDSNMTESSVLKKIEVGQRSAKGPIQLFPVDTT